jgi:teichuronic acid exporter
MSGSERLSLLEAPPDVPRPASSETAGSAAHNQAIATGVLWQGALRWLAQVLSWTATIVIARRLSAVDYGISGTATVLVGLLTMMSDDGIGKSLVMRRERDERTIAEAHGAAIFLGIAAMIFLIALAIPVARFYGEPRVTYVLLFLSIVPLLSALNSVPLAALQQQLEYRRLAAVDFGKAIIQAVAVLVCAVANFGYWSLAIGLVAGHLGAVAITRRFARIKPLRPTMRTLRPTLSYARHIAVGALSWYLYSNADFAVVGRVVGLTALGYYQFAWNVAALPGEKLANVLQAVVGPFFGSIGDDKVSLRHYFLVLSELLVAIMLPVLVGFALVTPIAIPLIFGARWSASVPVMQILVVCAAINSISMLSQHVLGSTGQAKLATRLNLTALFVLPVCFYIAARVSGTMAVASVWLFAQPVLMGVPLLRLKSTINLSVTEYLRSLRAPVLSAVLMAVVVWGLRSVVSGLAPVLQLVLLCCTGGAVYSVAFYVFFRTRVDAIVSLWKDRT